ncbi:MAG: pre-peptidase C-terminal domain-containing protein [Xanthomonadales bacterium]|nr:pre-peptidase C-terminal domain-containing protein [Xanthomonadales bacterium]MBN8794384.1 pre-peptidase C-terminal domain-containing protein [Stenotrophomonas nitritireducens]
MKRNASPAQRRLPRALPSARPWWTLPAACLATLLALPVNAAIVFPDQPLTTGNRVAPNILFILDDSGSMGWVNINNQSVSAITGPGGFSSVPDAGGVYSGTSITTESTGNDKMYMQSYATNSLYYNPFTNYQTWLQPNGNRMTGGTGFTSVYSDNNYVDYSPAGISSGTKDLSAKTQTFYVPKDPANTSASYLSNVSNYYRYQIPAGGTDVVRSEYGGVVLSGPFTVSGYPVTGQSESKKKNWIYHTITLPSNAASITATSSGGSGDADLYIRANSKPTTSSYSCRSTGGNNNESCTVDPTSSSTYVVGLYASSAFSNVTLNVTYTTTNSCSGSTSGNDWINCTSATPTGRSVSAELANFATWYSYHRTRIKSAKAGASEAFSGLGNKVRVGFRTIWNRNNFDIPVGDGNDGRFIDSVSPATSSRSTWFNRLFMSYASNGTPLQKALDDAGKYFSSSAASGPYGPESGSDQLSCRQNFTILTTDGYWNSGTAGSGNVDGGSGSLIKGPQSKSYTYSPAVPFEDAYSNTLADVAMKYWMTDLRTESYMGNASNPNNNNVPTSDADPAFWQHMVTFTLALGLKTTKGWGSVAEATAALQGGDSWPDPETASSSDNPKRLDDLLHAAVNGHGEFTPATSPALFAQGLNKALATITQRTSSFSNVTANSTSLNTGAQIFSASYVSGVWTGALKAQVVSRTGVGAQSWTATIPAVGLRKVFTASGTPGQAGTTGAAFPTSAQTSALDNSGVGPANYEATGAQNAAYIKGDASREDRNGVSNLRNRPTTVLGDIVNSSPAYVPGGAQGDGTSAGTVYIGANDGMLHAFDAANGKELFAYVPNILNFANLKQLSRGDYDHKFFVDGPIMVSPRTLTPGQNILVGTLGRGGKGLYALDVSAPASFNASNFKWERKDTPGSNMGNVVGAPVLAQVRNGSPTPAVVFGNGPNSTNDKAVLVVMNLSDGSVIREVPTDNTTNNGLMAPLGVYAADGKTLVYAYAGDMQGNIWKFDLRSSTPSAWSATRIFHAEKTSGTPQPITGGLASAIDLKTNKRWIFFGTGRFMTSTDADDKTTYAQSMYGVMDDGGSYTRANLTARSITVAGDYRYFEDKAALPSASKGWYVDLPGKGERIVQDVQIDNDYMVAASMIPEGDACDASGSGFLNAIDAFTGTSGGKSYFDLDMSGSTDDTGAGGHPIGSVNLGVGMPTRPVLLPGVGVVDGSAGVGASSFGKQMMTWQRVSWREIRND